MINTGNGTSVLTSRAHLFANVAMGVAGMVATGGMLYNSTIAGNHHREAVLNSRLDEDTRAIKMQLGDRAQSTAIGLAIAGVTCLGGAIFSEGCRRFRNS